VKVLLLHAWPLDERMWEPQIVALREAGFDPEAPRLYGRGPSIDAWAAQLLGDVQDPFVAVGSSMGGYVALALARRAPERVVGMVLVGSPTALDTPERRSARDQQIVKLRSAGASGLPGSDVPVEELAVAQEAIRDRSDASDQLGAFGGPVLVCVGEHDEHLSGDEAREIAHGALVGSVHVFPGAGHLVSVDQPDAFTAILLEFLAQWT
jgi:pimeloyl-ACP methyl ester carboxylesterase